MKNRRQIQTRQPKEINYELEDELSLQSIEYPTTLQTYVLEKQQTEQFEND